MDAINMLGSQDRPGPAPVDLTGLSPEEIRGISAGRTGRQQSMNQMFDLLMGQQRMKSTLASEDVARRISEEKLRQMQAPTKMTVLEDAEGKEYQVPEADMMRGMELMTQINRNRQLNLLTQEQIGAIEQKMPITADGQEYQVSPVHYKAISEAGRLRKEGERKAAASEALRGVDPGNLLRPENFSNLLTANPSAAAALINKMTPPDDRELSNAQYRQYADTNFDFIQEILGKWNPDDSLVDTANNMSRRLKDSRLLLKIEKRSLFHPLGSAKAVTVNLPPGVTADMAYDKADELGVDISEVLRNIHEYNTRRSE